MDEAQDGKRKVPPWVVTFADLMSILMCFFVLLLSFSELDAIRFRQIADQMAQAFGVQREIAAIDTPQGTTPIFDKFAPGTPEPTPTDDIRQQTSDQKPELLTYTSHAQVESTVQEIGLQKVADSLSKLQEALASEVARGTLGMRQDQTRIIIRVEERGSFPSGSAEMTQAFRSVLGRLAHELTQMPGLLTIEGHSDDVPIRTSRYSSNWDLSSARASSVVNALLHNPDIDPERLKVQGFAETRPRADNHTAEGRSLNRRVEIVIDLTESVALVQNRARQLFDQGRADLAFGAEWEVTQRRGVD
ncbi:MAG: type VI secretion system protein TssL [Gammaproteobacteria bacterium]|nr:MAG: type VI secretion system protein TssL [Gammaproteobacteria bacterium]